MTTLPPEPSCRWTAEIVWHERGRASTFAVVAHSFGAAPDVVVAESGPLEWPPTSAASVQALSDATRELEEGLGATGWQPLAPGSAWYARRFAWEPVDLRDDGAVLTPGEPVALAQLPQPADAGSPFARAPAWPAGAGELWRCEIAWDAGWVESRFGALAYAPRRRRGRSIAVSAPLPWLLMGRPDASSAAHREALLGLEAELERAGWERVGQGGDWHSTRFSWRNHDPPLRTSRDRERPFIGRRVSGNRRAVRIRRQ
jgi:hypothetical protein